MLNHIYKNSIIEQYCFFIKSLAVHSEFQYDNDKTRTHAAREAYACSAANSRFRRHNLSICILWMKTITHSTLSCCISMRMCWNSFRLRNAELL